jgi:hypothetical protein
MYLLYRKINAFFRRFGFGIHILLFPRDFAQDGLTTSRVRQFQDDEEFQESKAKTVQQIGRDFEIDWRSQVFLWCLKSTLNLPGWAVELGTGKAWMFTMALNHPAIENLGNVQLIDRFSTSAVDKLTGAELPATSHQSYSDNPGELESRFAQEKGVRITKGELPEVLLNLDIPQIKFLHVDLNAAEPEVQSLRLLWERLVPGAFVLLDDFGSPEFSESRKLMTQLSKELSFDILGMPTGQGLIIKNHLTS